MVIPGCEDVNLQSKWKAMAQKWNRCFPNHAIRISGAYLAVAGVWILMSDRVLLWLGRDPKWISAAQTYKGGVFVGVTATLLYVELSRYLTKIEARDRELYASNQALNAILDAAPVALCVLDRQARVRAWNSSAQRMFGWSSDEVLGRSLPIIQKDDSGALSQVLDRVLGGDRYTDLELVFTTKGGTRIETSVSLAPMTDSSSRPTGMVAAAADLTLRRIAEEQVRYLARRDSLTGLPNRRSLEESLGSLLAASHSDFWPVFLVIALDNFKLVNERIGHDLGDQVLSQLAEIIADILPADAILGRWSGDEFGVILKHISLEEAELTAERIRSEIQGSCFTVAAEGIPLTASIGMVALETALGLRKLLAAADEALTQAKNTGKNRVVFYQRDKQPTGTLSRASRWLFWIRRGQLGERMLLHLQPIVDIDSGTPDYYEVLLRVKGEDDEIVYPGEFIPVFERYGLMPEVDRCVLERVIELLVQRPTLNVFVNLSGTSLTDSGLLGWLERKIREYRIAPGRLVFEVTETAAITDRQKMQEWTSRLQNLGCSFALDDFGAGFSTFSYLRNLPVDWVKIDGSFVKNMDTDYASRAVVDAMTTVAQALGKRVIAEWVENEAVLYHLHSLGIRYAQGFFLGRPAPIEAARFCREAAAARDEE